MSTTQLTAEERARQRHNRWMLIGIFAGAFVPLLVAAAMYFSMRGGSAWGTTNRGELMPAGMTVHDIGLVPDAAAADAAAQAGRWLLLLNAQACARACEEAMHNMQQIPLLLGRDSDRVALAWVHGADVTLPPKVTSASARFPAQHDAGLLVIDPAGNVVLYYRYDQVGKPLLDDLKHLFKNTGM